MRRAFAVAVGLPLAAACAACAHGPADLTAAEPETRTAAAPGAASSDAGAGGYEYVARRGLGVVALAEARGVEPEVAARAVDRLADSLDGCATGLGREGKLVAGAIRVVARIGPGGQVDGVNVKLAPGDAVAANGLLCVVAPLKLLTFPPAPSASATNRGIAIEATWGSAPREAPPGSP